MSGNKVTFVELRQKKNFVVKHRKYASGNIHWRDKLYQSSKCQASLTTKNNEIVSNCDPEHNHSGDKENILARQAVIEMKDE